MKELNDLIKKPLVVISLGFVITVLVVGLLGYSFLLPQFTTLGDNQKKTTDLDNKLSVLNKNIALIKSINKDDLVKYQKAINSLVPESNDYLHFANLNDQLAANVGLAVDSFTISIATTPNTASPPPSPVSTGSAPGSTATKTQTEDPAAPVAAVSASLGYNVVVGYSGNFTAVDALLKNLKNLDRAVGVSKIIFSTSGSELSTSLTYFLPISVSDQGSVSSDNLVSLSSSDINLLTNLTDSTEFIAKPSAKPLGKNNPFE